MTTSKWIHYFAEDMNLIVLIMRKLEIYSFLETKFLIWRYYRADRLAKFWELQHKMNMTWKSEIIKNEMTKYFAIKWFNSKAQNWKEDIIIILFLYFIQIHKPANQILQANPQQYH